MSYCPNCGMKIEGHPNFCKYCGFALEKNNEQRQEFAGKVVRCPNCGEPLKSFVAKCPSCGYEFKEVKSSDSVKEFAKKLEEIEEGTFSDSGKNNIFNTFSLGKKKKYVTDDRIISYIKNFNVPNTKEDIIEFMILATSNINVPALSNNIEDSGVSSVKDFQALQARSQAWMTKVKQVYEKAKLTFGSDSDFYIIQDLYDKTTTSIQTAEKKQKKSIWIGFLVLIGILIVLLVVKFRIQTLHNDRVHELEETVKEIQTDIANEDYESALVKTNTLYMDDNFSYESEEYWDRQRESLLKIINNKMNEGK